MQTDLTVAGPLGDAVHFGEIESLAGLAADWGFDLNGADGDRDAAGCAATGFALEVVDGECGFAWGQRNKMQAAEGLAAIAAVVEEVALMLDQYTAFVARKDPDSKMIGQRAGRQPYGGFLAEGRSH